MKIIRIPKKFKEKSLNTKRQKYPRVEGNCWGSKQKEGEEQEKKKKRKKERNGMGINIRQGKRKKILESAVYLTNILLIYMSCPCDLYHVMYAHTILIHPSTLTLYIMLFAT